MRINIVFDNKAKNSFKSGWGFSSLVELKDKKLLFDTGCDGASLLYNLEKLNFVPEDIDIILLSHQHGDHTGGLFRILDSGAHPEVYVLESFFQSFKAAVSEKAELVEVSNGREIIEDVYTTGLLKNSPDEQSLILKTTRGILVIVGCSHPGVDRILKAAEKYGKIYGIIGGFHGFSELGYLEGVELIGACHCTQYKKRIRNKFPEHFREIKAGDIIEIKN